MVDSLGAAYVTGTTLSTNFPVTKGAFQTADPAPNGGGFFYANAFVSKFNPTGTALEYSTYLGGSTYANNTGTHASAIGVDSSGNAYVTGQTAASDFPVTKGSFQSENKGYNVNGYGDAFVTKLNPTGTALVYSTYIGGSAATFAGDRGTGIAIDKLGSAYVTGDTTSSDFPVTKGAFQTANSGLGSYYGDAFVTKFNPAGTALVYSTFLGGIEHQYSGNIGSGIGVDGAGNAYITGQTYSTAFPATKDAFQKVNSDSLLGCAFATIINPTGTALVYSTYLGGSTNDQGTGIAVNNLGNAYIAGASYSTDFPTTPGAFQRSNYSSNPSKNEIRANAFVAEFSSTATAAATPTFTPLAGTYSPTQLILPHNP